MFRKKRSKHTRKKLMIKNVLRMTRDYEYKIIKLQRP